jgi:DNA-directed RNA polymerase specialized sigma24 family protein
MPTPVSPLTTEVARRRRILGLEQRPIAERLQVPVGSVANHRKQES